MSSSFSAARPSAAPAFPAALRRVLLALAALAIAVVGAPGAAHAATLSVNFDHACAVLTDGSVGCFGKNTYGQLGGGSPDGSASIQPVAGISGATWVGAGGWTGCALLATGRVSCWGNNYSGQLGNGTYASSVSPVPVSGITDAVGIGIGAAYGCAVRRAGTVSCWGYAGDGSVGDGTNGGVTGADYRTRATPVPVVGLTDAVSVAAGVSMTCAKRTGGKVSCWGVNAGQYETGHGSLGDGTNLGSNVPVQVRGLTDATSISVGTTKACAVRSSGRVSCWGTDEGSALGNDDPDGGTEYAPVPVAGVTDAVGVATSLSHTCAVRANGRIVCWGDNSLGQLGNGTTTSSATPVQVSGITNAVTVSSNASSLTCATLATGVVKCWGDFNIDGTGLHSDPHLTPTTIASPALVRVVRPSLPTPPPTNPGRIESNVANRAFPRVFTGTATVTQTVRITNPGTTAVSGIAATINSSQFKLDSTPATSLAPGASTEFKVYAKPTSQGPIAGTLTVASSAGPITVDLSAYGKAPVATASVSSLDFGTTAVGTSVSKTITVTNTGEGSLNLAGYPLIEGAAAGDYAWSGSTAAIPAGKSTTFTVTFTPTATGARAATIRFSAKAAKIPLTGSGS